MERPMELMREAKTIAVVGVTTKKVRPANEIAEYLINAGFDVYLVNETEAGEQMLGKTIQPSVESLGVPVDIVDIFRRPADVPPHVEDAIASGAKVVWMQVGIVNEDAAARARDAGLEVVMDRCTMVEHRRLAHAR
ncbi:MAG: CoA-binding protein [Dehalococcoidia bacterium]|nr:CoA-binding protein [Dehalococcoidia bacterium]MCB9483138.1 CoA-binding protein [Dehalococcoidia bacterium]